MYYITHKTIDGRGWFSFDGGTTGYPSTKNCIKALREIKGNVEYELKFDADKIYNNKWLLMDALYKAKYSYYVLGTSHLSDAEYDALEQNIISLHGQEFLDLWYSVGYDEEAHNAIKINLKKEK